MHGSFTRTFIGTVFAGFCAACLLWFVRHIVERAIYENGDGWEEMFKKPKAAHHG